MGEIVEDHCPDCGKEFNKYGAFELSSMSGEDGFYPCSCSCGFEGRQWYKLRFEILQKKVDGEFEDLISD